MIRFHTQTAGCSLTAQQPMNNIVRVAFQALAAVLGGTQSLHTNSWDEALSLPTENAVQIALRTQQLVAYETGVADTVDPLAGSYFVEDLTREIFQRAEAYIQKIDEMGGAPEAIEKGYIQREIQDSAYRYQREIENEEKNVGETREFTHAVLAEFGTATWCGYCPYALTALDNIYTTKKWKINHRETIRIKI